MPPDDSQPSLVAQAKAGDRLALERLLISHSEVLSAHIARRIPASLQSTISVEDVTQQALLQTFLKIDLLRDTSLPAFSAWLKAIGEKTLMGMIKQERRHKRGGQFRRVEHDQKCATGSLIDLLAQLPEKEGATASRVMARGEAIAALQVGISELPPLQRRAIQLHLLQGKTLAETATERKSTPAAVRSLVHRGKQKLAETMGRASMWLSRK